MHAKDLMSKVQRFSSPFPTPVLPPAELATFWSPHPTQVEGCVRRTLFSSTNLLLFLIEDTLGARTNRVPAGYQGR
jgi:hypothetical protein